MSSAIRKLTRSVLKAQTGSRVFPGKHLVVRKRAKMPTRGFLNRIEVNKAARKQLVNSYIDRIYKEIGI